LGLGQETAVRAVPAPGGRSEADLPPPAVPADTYDAKYFLEVCAGSEQWRRSDGAEMDAMYDGLVRLAGVSHGERVVDIGSGRGELLVAAARAGAELTTGVEYSTAAVKLACQTLERHGVCGPAHVVAGDARALPLHDGMADVVTMCDVVEHLTPDELACSLAEVRRVLRPGGRVFIHTFPTRTIYNTTYRALRCILGRWRRWPRDPRSEHERLMHVNEQTLSSLRRALRRAGFIAIDVRRGQWVHVDFLPSQWTKALFHLLADRRLTRRLAIADLFATAYERLDS
jgi:ubiquinone/menaquinone biosynthesis C-methylase UbiE